MRGEQEGKPGEERNSREREKARRAGGLYEIKTKSVGKHIVSFETDWHTRRHSLSLSLFLSFYLSPFYRRVSREPATPTSAAVPRSSFLLLLFRCFSFRHLLPLCSARVLVRRRQIMANVRARARAIHEEHVNKASRGRIRSSHGSRPAKNQSEFRVFF